MHIVCWALDKNDDERESHEENEMDSTVVDRGPGKVSFSSEQLSKVGSLVSPALLTSSWKPGKCTSAP